MFNLSKKQWGVDRRKRENRGAEKRRAWEGCPAAHQLCLLPRKFLIVFHFKMVHFGAISYTNSKVLFAIKCMGKYVIMVFLAIDSDPDMKTSSFHQPRKLSLSGQSFATHIGFTATDGMCYRSA